MSCNNRHLNAGQRERSLPLVAVAGMFPEYNRRSGRLYSLNDRIVDCFLRSENATGNLDGSAARVEEEPEALPMPTSKEVLAIAAYITWLARGAEVGKNPVWRGQNTIAANALIPIEKLDPEKGEAINLAADQLPPLRFVRNYLDPYRDVFKLEFPDINTAVGISRALFPVNASDAIWQRYRLGERWKIIDPSTKQSAVRNIFLGDGDISVKALQARGTVFWQCNIALGAVVQELAQAMQLPAQDVRTELIAGLNPGVRLVPSHAMAVGLVQERGFTYMNP